MPGTTPIGDEWDYFLPGHAVAALDVMVKPLRQKLLKGCAACSPLLAEQIVEAAAAEAETAAWRRMTGFDEAGTEPPIFEKRAGRGLGRDRR